MSEHGAPSLPTIDIRERGAEVDGEPQILERRLFMQLQVLECGRGVGVEDVARSLISGLEERGSPGVIYQDVSHPGGLGVLSWSDDPAHFVDQVRPVIAPQLERGVRLRPEFTMLGRTYSVGFERDLAHWMLERPAANVCNPKWKWAVWYPLRRTGAFEQLSGKEKGSILHEHATIGRAYGAQDLAHDVRLACHGLDASDNEFVIGLIGEELYPLSHVVQSMRKTRQTSEFIAHMGPFFVGRAQWQSRGASR